MNGGSGVFRPAPDLPNQRGPADSATQSPGLRPTPLSIAGVPGEVSHQKVASCFPVASHSCVASPPTLLVLRLYSCASIVWAKDSLLFRKSGMIQEEGTGNTEVYVHRHLNESVHRVADTDTVTGRVWSLSPCPRPSHQRGPADSASNTS